MVLNTPSILIGPRCDLALFDLRAIFWEDAPGKNLLHLLWKGDNFALKEYDYLAIALLVAQAN